MLEFHVFGTQINKIIEKIIIFYELIKVKLLTLFIFFYDLYG